MLKKTITYKGVDGQDITEDFYFNLSRAELIEMETAQEGGMQAHLEAIVATQNNRKILETFKSILKRAYGKRSEDGKRLIKNDEVWEEFVTSEAYSELIMEFFTDGEKAAEFINAIKPAGLEEAAAKMQAAQTASPVAAVPDPAPRQVTPAEASRMDQGELQRGMASGTIVIVNNPA